VYLVAHLRPLEFQSFHCKNIASRHVKMPENLIPGKDGDKTDRKRENEEKDI
jgi:hypothetical protein